MRYLISLCVCCLLLSCKSADNRPPWQEGHFDDSVPPMKIIINQQSVNASWIVIQDCFDPDPFTGCVWNKNPMMLRRPSVFSTAEITGILENQFIFTSAPGKIYLSIIIRKTHFSIFEHGYEHYCCGIPMAFGAPMTSIKCTLTLEAAVINTGGQVIRTYTSTVSGKTYVGGAANYSNDSDGLRMSYIMALQSSCRDIRKQMKNDITLRTILYDK